MVKLLKLEPLTKEYLESIDFYWHTDIDNTPYIGDELVEVKTQEANAYYQAVNELYDMYVQACEHVIENNLFHELGIPFNLVEIIKMSWENDVHWHLYGRFDLSGGIDGKPIKLIEFNADTPTSLFESAVIQWAILKKNGLDEQSQFNNIYDAIKENFKRLVVMNSPIEDFERYYQGWKILFSSIAGNIEDEITTKLLKSAAEEAGFVSEFAYVDDVNFSSKEGVFLGEENYEYWFKLIPWENIAIEEPDLALILKDIIENQVGIILNPAYTLLFQSKGMMKILWDLFPHHPLLLETSFEPLNNKTEVIKPCFGREGENIKIVDSNGSVIAQNPGEYGNFKEVHQEYVEFVKDSAGNSYQAGVFFAYEGCGLGFRRGGKILDNYAKFIGHIIKD